MVLIYIGIAVIAYFIMLISLIESCLSAIATKLDRIATVLESERNRISN